MRPLLLTCVAMVTVVHYSAVQAAACQLDITASGSYNGEGCVIRQSGDGQATISGNPYSVHQAGSAKMTIGNGKVLSSVGQEGSGNIDISGSVGGAITQAGSGVITVRGIGGSSGGQSEIGQAGSCKAYITGDRSSVIQASSAILYLKGNVQGLVRQEGSGLIDITGSAGGPIQREGSGTITVHSQ